MDSKNGVSGAVYGLGFVGALIYYIQHSSGLIPILWGILKAVVWPAMLVYRALEIFRM